MFLCKDRAKKHLRLMLLLPALLPLTACALSGGPIVGQVVEEGTHRPIPRAIVVAKWVGSVPAFADSQTVCVHVESTVTDQQGKYELPGWSKPSTVGPVVRNLGPVVIAYKPGYAWSTKPSQQDQIVYLARFEGSVDERFQYFSSVISNTSCGSSGESGKNLYWLWMALHEEAKSFAVTTEQKKRADRLRSHAQSTIVDETKPKRYDEHGNVVNIDPRDNFKVEPLR